MSKLMYRRESLTLAEVKLIAEIVREFFSDVEDFQPNHSDESLNEALDGKTAITYGDKKKGNCLYKISIHSASSNYADDLLDVFEIFSDHIEHNPDKTAELISLINSRLIAYRYYMRVFGELQTQYEKKLYHIRFGTRPDPYNLLDGYASNSERNLGQNPEFTLASKVFPSEAMRKKVSKAQIRKVFYYTVSQEGQVIVKINEVFCENFYLIFVGHMLAFKLTHQQMMKMGNQLRK